MELNIIIFTVAAFFVQASLQCPTCSQQIPLNIVSGTVISQPSVQYASQQIVSQPCSCSNQVVSQPIRSQPCSNQVISQPIINQPCCNQGISPPIINQPCCNQGISPPIISQPCNQGPVISQPCSNQILSPVISQLQQYLPSPVINQPCSAPVIPTSIAASPCVATAIIDNSVSNSLANALQLLIVSDLIESTLKNRDCGCGCGSIIESPIYETIEYQECVPIQQYETCCPCDYYSSPVVETYGYQEYVCPQQVTPCAAEVVFPASIPAQLTCNLGYMPTTVPVVNVAVEALPGGFGGSCGCSSCGCSSCGCNSNYYY